jgi:hypothetical protein
MDVVFLTHHKDEKRQKKAVAGTTATNIFTLNRL